VVRSQKVIGLTRWKKERGTETALKVLWSRSARTVLDRLSENVRIPFAASKGESYADSDAVAETSSAIIVIVIMSSLPDSAQKDGFVLEEPVGIPAFVQF
jgi:hypothetical protein